MTIKEIAQKAIEISQINKFRTIPSKDQMNIIFKTISCAVAAGICGQLLVNLRFGITLAGTVCLSAFYLLTKRYQPATEWIDYSIKTVKKDIKSDIPKISELPTLPEKNDLKTLPPLDLETLSKDELKDIKSDTPKLSAISTLSEKKDLKTLPPLALETLSKDELKDIKSDIPKLSAISTLSEKKDLKTLPPLTLETLSKDELKDIKPDIPKLSIISTPPEKKNPRFPPFNLIGSYFDPVYVASKIEIGKILEIIRPTFVSAANPFVNREDRDRYQALVLKISKIDPSTDKEKLFEECLAQCLTITDFPLRFKAYKTCFQLDCKAALAKKEENWKIKLNKEDGKGILVCSLTPAYKQILWDVVPYFRGLSSFEEMKSKIVDFTKADEITDKTFGLFSASIVYGQIKDFDAAIQILKVADRLSMKHLFVESWIIKELKAFDINSQVYLKAALYLANPLFDLRSLNVSDELIDRLSQFLVTAGLRFHESDLEILTKGSLSVIANFSEERLKLEADVFTCLKTLKPKSLVLTERIVCDDVLLEKFFDLISLESLSFTGNRCFGKESDKKLLDKMSTLPKLKSLSFEKTEFKADLWPFFPHIEKLNMGKSEYTRDSLPSPISSLLEKLADPKNLKEFKFQWRFHGGPPEDAALVKWDIVTPNTETLQLSNIYQFIDIADFSCIINRDFSEVSPHAFKSFSHTTSSLTGSKLFKFDPCLALKEIKEIKSFELRNNFYSFPINKFFNPSLESLNLSYPHEETKPGTFAALINEFKEGKNLKTLCLVDWPLDLEGLTQLPALSGLENLNLSKPRKFYKREGLTYIKVPILTISQLPKLKKLDLEAWPEFSETLTLFEELRKHLNLESLNLSSNDWLTDDHLKYLASIPNLTTLNLKGCKLITNEGILAFRKEIFRLSGREITILFD